MLLLCIGKLKVQILEAFSFDELIMAEIVSLSRNSNCTQRRVKTDALKSGELLIKAVASELRLK